MLTQVTRDIQENSIPGEAIFGGNIDYINSIDTDEIHVPAMSGVHGSSAAGTTGYMAGRGYINGVDVSIGNSNSIGYLSADNLDTKKLTIRNRLNRPGITQTYTYIGFEAGCGYFNVYKQMTHQTSKVLYKGLVDSDSNDRALFNYGEWSLLAVERPHSSTYLTPFEIVKSSLEPWGEGGYTAWKDSTTYEGISIGTDFSSGGWINAFAKKRDTSGEVTGQGMTFLLNQDNDDTTTITKADGTTLRMFGREGSLVTGNDEFVDNYTDYLLRFSTSGGKGEISTRSEGSSPSSPLMGVKISYRSITSYDSTGGFEEFSVTGNQMGLYGDASSFIIGVAGFDNSVYSPEGIEIKNYAGFYHVDVKAEDSSANILLKKNNVTYLSLEADTTATDSYGGSITAKPSSSTSNDAFFGADSTNTTLVKASKMTAEDFTFGYNGTSGAIGVSTIGGFINLKVTNSAHNSVVDGKATQYSVSDPKSYYGRITTYYDNDGTTRTEAADIYADKNGGRFGFHKKEVTATSTLYGYYDDSGVSHIYADKLHGTLASGGVSFDSIELDNGTYSTYITADAIWHGSTGLLGSQTQNKHVKIKTENDTGAIFLYGSYPGNDNPSYAGYGINTEGAYIELYGITDTLADGNRHYAMRAYTASKKSGGTGNEEWNASRSGVLSLYTPSTDKAKLHLGVAGADTSPQKVTAVPKYRPDTGHLKIMYDQDDYTQKVSMGVDDATGDGVVETDRLFGYSYISTHRNGHNVVIMDGDSYNNGTLKVANSAGVTMFEATKYDGSGGISKVYNASGNPIVSMTPKSATSGRLEIFGKSADSTMIHNVDIFAEANNSGDWGQMILRNGTNTGGNIYIKAANDGSNISLRGHRGYVNDTDTGPILVNIAAIDSGTYAKSGGNVRIYDTDGNLKVEMGVI